MRKRDGVDELDVGTEHALWLCGDREFDALTLPQLTGVSLGDLEHGPLWI